MADMDGAWSDGASLKPETFGNRCAFVIRNVPKFRAETP